jgi:hypothetical protein
MIQTKFSASRISELLAGGSGKTAQSYILDLALQSIGIKDQLDTPALRHGINNQLNAFEQVIKPLYPSAEWLDVFIPINEFAGASPDFIIDGNPADIKCPFYIDTYIEQINKVPTKYYNQVQMQMMACKADIGRLCFYLTKAEEWGHEGDVIEYPFPLELRFKIFEFTKDEELHERILEKVEESEPKKVQMIQMLTDAEVIEEEQFFYEQFNGFCYRKINESNNILSLDKLYRIKDKFYFKK